MTSKLFLLISVLAFTLLSFIHPYEMGTWWMEAAPVLIGLPILICTRKSFPLTQLLYILLWLHALTLLLGAHYTYARVPLGEWAQEAFNFERNHYDRFGHFMQGFVPAIVARELLLRTSSLKSGKWLFVIITLSCLGISAIYEMIEWAAAAIGGQAAEAFLGTQGDVWDTQKDMAWAVTGAVISQLILGRYHQRQLERMSAQK